MDKLQNPIVVGLVVFVVVYAYLRWDANRKYKEDPKSEKKKVNILIPTIVGGLSWFLTGSYLKQYCGNNAQTVEVQQINHPNKAVPYCLQSMSQGSVNFSPVQMLQKRSLRLPKTDVFIDLGNF